ncbi:MAG TPA: helix-turn-helix domain-containing protein, partial [Solirubrobacterales bacterium]|nr:helix-turn-helix domain-containing protein [Solirubrobacterales bacterium]
MGITRIGDAEAIDAGRRDGRQRLLNGARKLLAEKGYAGMELRDVAEVGRAPRGSIYHHFPGGKRQLAVEAAELEGSEIRAAIERSLSERGLAETLTMFGEMFRRRVKD